MHHGRCATINIYGNTIGFLGQIHSSYANSIDLKATYIFDLNLEYLLKASSTDIEYQQIAKYPSILRDIAFVDRKSTRLNSSHVSISYAVLCLKNKKQKNNTYNH